MERRREMEREVGDDDSICGRLLIKMRAGKLQTAP